MRSISVIDAETDPFRKGRVPRPFVWGWYNGTRFKTFDTGAELAAWIGERDEICYAHNGGRFDFHFLLEYLEPYTDLTIINGRIACCRIGLCELRDSFCIIPQGLASYQKDEIDYGLFEPGERDKKKNREAIIDYLRSDCVNLYDMVRAFVDRFGAQLTLASSAMKQWQKISKEIGIPPCERTDEAFYNEFAPYYYGGRVECFASGIIDTDFSVYDINSAYPYAMLHQHPYSANYSRVSGYEPKADFYRLSCISHGALPFRGLGGEDGKSFGLRFPRDNVVREYTVTGWEYAAARATKSISRVKVHESITFARHVDFSEYINTWWREREIAKANNDALGSLFAKLMMNSLYGKFAANPDNYANYMNVPHTPKYIRLLSADDPSPAPTSGGRSTSASRTRRWKWGGELGPWLLAQADLEEHAKRYYNVATGASITGFVRAMLWRAIHASRGVLYCDTDSIAVERPGKDVRLSAQLGDWKHEGDFDRAGIAGKKLYIFRGKLKDGKREYKTASKGVKLTNEQLWRVAKGGTVSYTSDVPTFSVKESPRFITRRVVNTA